MQIHQLFSVDRNTPFIVACSGGVDSMAVVDFYKRGGKDFRVAYYHHRTLQADKMMQHVQKWCELNKIEMLVDWMPTESRKVWNTLSSLKKKASPEEWMRNWRYAWLRDCGLRFHSPIVTAHHLNDVAETWIFSTLHGNPKLINANVDCIYRPFLTNEKSIFVDWCTRHDVSWVEDTSNKDVQIPRNRIRHNILPECLKVNPGLMKVLRKKYPKSMGDMTYKDAQVAER
jgi:tRNA(Ile)-lysidine synthase